MHADRREWQTRQEPRQGAAAVELAVVLPLFFLLLFAVVEFGRAMMAGELLTHAAREGARLGTLSGKSNADVEQKVASLVRNTLGVAPEHVRTVISVTAAPGNPAPGNQVARALSRDVIRVQVRVPFDQLSFLPAAYLRGASLMGEAAMQHE